jgi:hypothetical protein
MKVTNDTRALAHEILAYWLRFNRHDQTMWVGDEEPVITAEKIGKAEVNVCNTTMCAAGTAVFLTTTPKKFLKLAREHFSDDEVWTNRAGDLLGLDYEEAYRVFHSDNATAKKLVGAIAEGDEVKFKEILAFDYESL